MCIFMYLYINVCLCSVCMGVCSCVFSACMYLRVCSVCFVRVCCVYLCIDVQKCVYDPSLREFVHVCSCVLIGVYVFTCVPRVCRVCAEIGSNNTIAATSITVCVH